MLQVGVGGERGRSPRPDHAALLDDVIAVGQTDQGADPDADTTQIPVLIIQGAQDERMPTSLAQRYADAAGSHATIHVLEGDHFLLAKRTIPGMRR